MFIYTVNTTIKNLNNEISTNSNTFHLENKLTRREVMDRMWELYDELKSTISNINECIIDMNFLTYLEKYNMTVELGKFHAEKNTKGGSLTQHDVF
jgi:hypothetical protein